MRFKSKVFAATGGNPVTIHENDAGWKFSALYGRHQIACTGLDGGTFKVEALIPGSDDFYEIAAAGQAANKIIVVPDIAAHAFKVTFVGLGGAQAAKVILTSRPIAAPLES